MNTEATIPNLGVYCCMLDFPPPVQERCPYQLIVNEKCIS